MYPLDPSVAGMVVAVAFFVTAGGVLVLRPLAKRLGDILELITKERRSGVEADVRRTRELLEQMDARLHLIEERQDFTERLLGTATETDTPQRADERNPTRTTSTGG